MKIDTSIQNPAEIDARIANLPRELKDVVFADSFHKSIINILGNLNLNPELAGRIEGILILIFLGMEYRSALKDRLKNSLGIEANDLSALTIALEGEILKPNIIALMKAYEGEEDPDMSVPGREATLQSVVKETSVAVSDKEHILARIEDPSHLLSPIPAKQPVPNPTKAQFLVPKPPTTQISRPAAMAGVPKPPISGLGSVPKPPSQNPAIPPSPTYYPKTPMMHTMKADVQADPIAMAKLRNVVSLKKTETREETIKTVPSTQKQNDPYRESF